MPKPPSSVQRAAARGLARRKARAKTTQRPGGTAVGVARARDLSGGRNVSERTLKRMKAFFDRHDNVKESTARRRNPSSPASIAWDLWGGSAGRQWAQRELRKLERTRKTKKTRKAR